LYSNTINDAFMREAMKAPYMDRKPVMKEGADPEAESQFV
jgi:hypothetical protein